MYNLEKILLKEAVKHKFEYAIATAHPNNIPSIRTIQKAGLKLEKSNILLGNYIRNVYTMKIN